MHDSPTRHGRHGGRPHPADAADEAAEVRDDPATDPAVTDPPADEQAAVADPPVESAAAEIERLRSDLQHMLADYQNYRRRRDEEAVAASRFASRKVIEDILPALDNLERALAAAEQTHNLESLIKGVASTHRQLLAALAKAGVKPIDAAGHEFDPRYHEAIGHADSPDLPPHTVAEEVQRGYTMHDLVIRPAMVKVTGD